MNLSHPRRWAQGRVESWAVSAQQQARRNAMVASTALARRRAERMAVEEYFTALRPATEDVSTAAEHAPDRAARA